MANECPECQTNNAEDSKFCNECATPLAQTNRIDKTKTLRSPSRKSLIGFTLADKYKIISELGRGGMGIVYRAEDIRLQRTVALKFLPPELASDEEARERFVQEARAASALDHNNICTIYEIADSEDEHFFIAMAYYEGQSLKEKIQQGPLDEKETIELVIQAALGLSKAHDQGIVHRDIKPANIIISRDGVAKILDFGIAKLTGQIGLTQTGHKIGTVAYMSPEQTEGKNVDMRTDIWSLGVVLYEMLTGESPFSGENERSMMYSILNKDPSPMRKLRPNLPDVFEHIVATALAKKPENRYQNMEDLLDDLRSVAEGFEPIKAKVKSFQKRILGIRRPFFFMGASALFFLLIVISFLLFWGRTKSIESIAIFPIENVTLDEDLDYLCRIIPDEIIKLLQRIESIKVPSRVAVEPYVGKPLVEIGSTLKVSKVLTSTLEPAGERLRINLVLTGVEDGSLLWTENLDFSGGELLNLQGEMIQKIIDALKLNLGTREREFIFWNPTNNDKAYQLYAKGEFEYQRPSPQNWKNAAEYYTLAISEDPEFALAHASLAQVYWNMGGQEIMDIEIAYPLARQHAEKALDLDENLAKAHCVQANILAFIDYNWKDAEIEFEKALAINSKDPYVHDYFGYFLMCTNRHDEAIKEAMRAIEIDGTNEYFHGGLAYFLAGSGRFEEGARKYQEILDDFPQRSFPYVGLSYCYACQGKFDEALSAALKAVDLAIPGDGLMNYQGYLAFVYAILGKKQEALDILEKLEKQNAPDGFTITVYLGLGDLDTTFKMYEDAYRDRKEWFINSMYGWYSQFVEDDPRYHDLLKRTGLDQY